MGNVLKFCNFLFLFFQSGKRGGGGGGGVACIQIRKQKNTSKIVLNLESLMESIY
jgi:hypothetical protein